MTMQPLMHIGLVMVKALGKLTRTFIHYLMETCRVSTGVDGRPALQLCVDCRFFFVMSKGGQSKIANVEIVTVGAHKAPSREFTAC